MRKKRHHNLTFAKQKTTAMNSSAIRKKVTKLEKRITEDECKLAGRRQKFEKELEEQRLKFEQQLAADEMRLAAKKSKLPVLEEIVMNERDIDKFSQQLQALSTKNRPASQQDPNQLLALATSPLCCTMFYNE